MEGYKFLLQLFFEGCQILGQTNVEFYFGTGLILGIMKLKSIVYIDKFIKFVCFSPVLPNKNDSMCLP